MYLPIVKKSKNNNIFLNLFIRLSVNGVRGNNIIFRKYSMVTYTNVESEKNVQILITYYEFNSSIVLRKL